ncbi:MAG: phage holin family protein [Flavobacteriales bacterium]|nr:phage holin family protein [Flavobacteriales bacterium]
MQLLIRLIVSTIAVLVTDLLLSGVRIGDMETAHGVLTALLVAVVLGLLNAVIRPLIILLTLPVTILTLGLFVLVINAGMVLLAAKIVPEFAVDSFWWALGFSVVQWIVQGMLNGLDGGRKESRES